MSGVRTLVVAEAEAGMRLDRWFKARFPDLRHAVLEKLLRTGQVRVAGGRVKASRRLEAGESVRVPPLPAASPAPLRKSLGVTADREFIRSLVIYEDESIIALNKPFGLAVQGGTKTARHIDGMLDALGNGERPRLVHRLDRDTGGLLIIAKSRRDAADLGACFQRHEIEKTYWALVAGSPRPRQGTIDLPIGKEPDAAHAERERMAPKAGRGGKSAVTDYQIVDEAGDGISFLALRPRTGRTHQLRVHCAAMGAPIVGDRKYGAAKGRIEGVSEKLHLFCRSMTFPHPRRRKPLSLTAPLTGHMLETWKFFGFDLKSDVEWPDDIR